MTESYTYEAFISYRHLPPDTRAAKAVQRALENYRFPKDIARNQQRKRFRRCFRDQDELPLAPDLGSGVEDALKQSRWLIVICTPDLPASGWCLREIDYFISLGRRDRIIPVLACGEPAESYPAQICTEVIDGEERPVEPFGADIRGHMLKKLRFERMRIAARMLGVGFDDLRKREKERKLRFGLGVLAGVMALLVAFLLYAWRQNRLLLEEKNRTAAKTTELLIEKSQNSVNDNQIADGLGYALEAYEMSRGVTDEYDSAIKAALEASLYPGRFANVGSLDDKNIVYRKIELSADGRYASCMAGYSVFDIFDTLTRQKLYRINGHACFNEDGSLVFVCDTTQRELRVLNTPDGAELYSGVLPEGCELLSDRVLGDGVLPLADSDNRLFLFRPLSDTLTAVDGVTVRNGYGARCTVHLNGKQAIVYGNGVSRVLDPYSGTVLASFDTEDAEYTDDGRYLRVNSGYYRWDTLEEAAKSERSGSLSPDGRLIAAADGYKCFRVYDTATGEELYKRGETYMNTLYRLYFIDDEYLLASHGEIEIYRVSDMTPVLSLSDPMATYGFSAGGGLLAVPLRAGGTRLYLIDGGSTAEEQSACVYPSLQVRETAAFDRELFSSVVSLPLIGTWQGSTHYASIASLGLSGQIDGFTDEDYITFNSEEEGLFFPWEGEMVRILPTDLAVSMIYVSSDGRWQVTLHNGGGITVYRAAESAEAVMTIPGNNFDRLCAAFSGDILAVGAYVENVNLYDLQSGEIIGAIPTGEMGVQLQFSPDGSRLMVLSAVSGQVEIADVGTMTVIGRIDCPDDYNSVRIGFTEDGNTAAFIRNDGSAASVNLLSSLTELVELAEKYVR